MTLPADQCPSHLLPPLLHSRNKRAIRLNRGKKIIATPQKTSKTT
jgi:hypothetical protein